jgi:hypothetical protein
MKKKSLVVIDNILKTLVFSISFLNCLSLQKAYSSFTVNMKNKKGKMCPNGFQLDNRHRSIRKASFFFKKNFKISVRSLRGKIKSPNSLKQHVKICYSSVNAKDPMPLKVDPRT